MADIDNKTIFISYRRDAAAFIARAVFMDLRAHGYDVFMDIESLDAGTFDTMLLNQIASRAHFIIILAPGTVERCIDEHDWVRREIEYAIDTKRNIVPLMVNTFSFNGTQQYLTGKLNELKRYSGISVPIDFFDEAMERLRTRFLKPNRSVVTQVLDLFRESVPIPTISTSEQEVVRERIHEIVNQPVPTKEELTAEHYFGLGYGLQEQGDLEAAIAQYDEAIRVNSQYRRAYYNRGLAYQRLQHLSEAERDYLAALEIEPNSAKAHNNLGLVWYEQKQFAKAIAALTHAIEIDPDYAVAYFNRASAHKANGDIVGAVVDTETYQKLEERQKQIADAITGGSLNSSANGNIEILLPEDLMLGGSTRPLLPEQHNSALLAEQHNSAKNQFMAAGIATDVGMVRLNNQDACGSFISNRYSVEETPSFGYFVVCDGMGGHHDGEKAAAIALSHIMDEILSTLCLPMIRRETSSFEKMPAEIVIETIRNANQKVLEETPEGGTTTTVAVVVGDLVYIGHVGDCRAYLVTQDGIDQLTRDHSLVARLIELGKISIEEAADHPQKNVLYRALGQSEDLEVDIFTRRFPVGTKLVLCSDGLWSLVSDAEIHSTVLECTPQEAADRLVTMANTRGGSDNISVIVVAV